MDPLITLLFRFAERVNVTALPEEEREFIWYGAFHPVESSNVYGARYSWQRKVLTVTYLNGATWAYSPISKKQAVEFITGPSKGTFLWDKVRVRGVGNSHLHQRKAVKLSS